MKDPLYQLLFEGEGMDLYYCDKQILYMDFHGYQSKDTIEEGCLALLQQLKDLQCVNVINDNTRVRGTWIPWISFIEKEIMPKLLEAGLKRAAHIYSKDHATIASMNEFLGISVEYETQVFESFEDASNWLIGKTLHGPHHKRNHTFRTKEGLKQIISDEIYFISRFDRKTVIQTEEEQIVVPGKNLSEMEDLFNSPDIKRVHKSYVVNIPKIKKLQYHAGGYYKAYFKNFGETFVMVSKSEASHIKHLMNLST